MDDWDDDSQRLCKNLNRVLRKIRDNAHRRDVPSVEDARDWHKDTMAGLYADHKEFIGGFRGEGGIELKHYKVAIGDAAGVPPARVAEALKNFEKRLQKATKALDNSFSLGDELDADRLNAVLELAAWVHTEWVRIHPFANGNGRTARLWANFIMLRYGLPPVVGLRPRPDVGYAAAAARAMKGEWESTIKVFHEMLLNYLNIS